MNRLVLLLLALGPAGFFTPAIADKLVRIENVKLFDGYGIHDNATVEFEGPTIAQIYQETPPSPDSSTIVVDGTGKTLIPGLINGHMHFWQSERQTPREQLAEAAQAGVLTVIDLFNSVEQAAELRELRDTPGYAYFLSSGTVVTVADGHGTQFEWDIPTLGGPEEAKTFIADRKSEGSDVIKILIEDRGGQAPRLSDKSVRAAARASKSEQLISVAHVSRIKDALLAFDSGIDGIAHLWSRDGTGIDDKALAQLSSRDFFVTPTLIGRRNRPELLQYSQRELARLHQSGVPIVAGTDPTGSNAVNYGTDLYTELALFVDAGLKPIDALKTATSNAASAYRLSGRGVIRPGATADLLLVDGDPTADIRDLEKIEAIWQSGQKIR